MRGVLTQQYGNLVQVEFLDPDTRGQLLHQLLEAAQRNGTLIRTDTGGGGHPTYWAPLATVEAAGFLAGRTALAAAAEPSEPPRAGRGASQAVWLAFLDEHQIPVPDRNASRSELIHLWDNR